MAFATGMPLILVKAGNIRMSAQNLLGYGTVFDNINDNSYSCSKMPQDV